MRTQLAAFVHWLKSTNLRASLKSPTMRQTLDLLVVEQFQVRRDERGTVWPKIGATKMRKAAKHRRAD